MLNCSVVVAAFFATSIHGMGRRADVRSLGAVAHLTQLTLSSIGRGTVQVTLFDQGG